MPVATPGQMAGALRAAGFSGGEIVTGVAIGLAESSGRTDVTHRNADGSTDYGTWQINSVHKDVLSIGNWADLYTNAKMARMVYVQAGHSWHPWATFNSGSYRSHLGEGMSGAGNPSNVPPTATNADISVSGAFDGITKFIQFITDVHNWIRLGQFAAGMVLLLIALWQLSGIDAGKVASTAVKVAAVA